MSSKKTSSGRPRVYIYDEFDLIKIPKLTEPSSQLYGELNQTIKIGKRNSHEDFRILEDLTVCLSECIDDETKDDLHRNLEDKQKAIVDCVSASLKNVEDLSSKAALTPGQEHFFNKYHQIKDDVNALSQFEGALTFALADVRHLKRKLEVYKPQEEEYDTLICEALGQIVESKKRQVLDGNNDYLKSNHTTGPSYSTVVNN